MFRMEKFWQCAGERENEEHAAKLKTWEISKRGQDLLTARTRPRNLKGKEKASPRQECQNFFNPNAIES